MGFNEFLLRVFPFFPKGFFVLPWGSEVYSLELLFLTKGFYFLPYVSPDFFFVPSQSFGRGSPVRLVGSMFHTVLDSLTLFLMNSLYQAHSHIDKFDISFRIKSYHKDVLLSCR